MRSIRFLVGTCLVLSLGTTTAAQTRGASPLKLVQTIALPGVEGRIDHMAIDRNRRFLYIAALGSNLVKVVGLDGHYTRDLMGFHEPQGIAYTGDSSIDR